MAEDPIAPFVQQWQLDVISEKVLRKCAPALQNDIMTKFNPKDTSRNCNALFMAFVKSLRRDDPDYAAHDPALNVYSGGYAGQLGSLPPGGQMSMAPQMPYTTFPAPEQVSYVPTFPPVARTPQTSHFLAQWQLNTEATNFLDSLCGPVQDEVIRDFSQKIVDEDRTGDPNVAFLKFARERAVRVFIEQWQLDAESWTHLLSLPPDTQVIAMASFNPCDLTNLNQQFQYFASSCLAATPMPAVTVDPALVREFTQRWQLNDQNIAMLQSLEPSLQAEIMTTFVPRDLTKDANGMFRAFLNSRTAMPPYGAQAFALPSGDTGIAPGVDYFIQQWKLDLNSSTFLRSLPAATQTDIINAFYPKDTSRDCNGIFMSFAKSRLSGTRSPGTICGQTSTPDLGNLRAENPDDVEKFISSWALNATSMELFNESTTETKQIVMNEFKPHDVFRDVNSVFQSFVRSRVVPGTPPAKRARHDDTGLDLQSLPGVNLPQAS